MASKCYLCDEKPAVFSTKSGVPVCTLCASYIVGSQDADKLPELFSLMPDLELEYGNIDSFGLEDKPEADKKEEESKDEWSEDTLPFYPVGRIF